MCLAPTQTHQPIAIPSRQQVRQDATELLDSFMAIEADTNCPGLMQAGFDMPAIRARVKQLSNTVRAYCREAFIRYQHPTSAAEALHAATVAHAYFVATYQTPERAVAIAQLRLTEDALHLLIGQRVRYPSRSMEGGQTIGTVLDTYDAGDIRVDTDGVIGWQECELVA
ncbi:hypothetical protein [Hymenobacter sp. DG01]|uniref:hypothetical protein n=1 Tax=Hymenobacter sp. DG01 TaxID=2584940 RepID=UPI00111E3A5B|nr:hypothetical protein [Hymenobacter sp. DG01]